MSTPRTGISPEVAGHPNDGRSEAEAVATTVLELSTVAALSSGPAGQFRSYLPGGRSVPGVRLDGDELEVNVVAHFGTRLADLGSTVIDALGPLATGRTVTVHVDDIVLPGEDLTGVGGADAADSVVETVALPASPPLTDES